MNPNQHVQHNKEVAVGTTMEVSIDCVCIQFSDYKRNGYCRPRDWKANAYISEHELTRADGGNGWESIPFGAFIVADIVMGQRGPQAVNLRSKEWAE